MPLPPHQKQQPVLPPMPPPLDPAGAALLPIHVDACMDDSYVAVRIDTSARRKAACHPARRTTGPAGVRLLSAVAAVT